jgi:hypothetical protein
MLHMENAFTSTLASFIFEDIPCRWGVISDIVTDNGPSYIQALNYLHMRYKITHIWISPSNSQANGIVKRYHYDVWKAIMKSCDEMRHVGLAQHTQSSGLSG